MYIYEKWVVRNEFFLVCKVNSSYVSSNNIKISANRRRISTTLIVCVCARVYVYVYVYLCVCVFLSLSLYYTLPGIVA